MTLTWQHIYLLVFLLGGTLSLVFTPGCRLLAEKWDIVDRPKNEKHKQHRAATPYLGGLAMFGAWIVAILLGYLLVMTADLTGISPDIAAHLEGLRGILPRLGVICLGAFLAMGLGLWDDKFGMKAQFKFAGQFLVAALAVSFGGVKVTLFVNNPVFVWCITVFWFMLLMNATNFFDNMDGLAVGTITIAMGLFTVTAILTNQYFVATLSSLTCGVCLGFWFYNHTPASIFMGDSGSHFLGYMAAVISAGTSYFSHQESLTRFPILIPLFILAIPLFDALVVVMIRLRNGKPIYVGDHNHISHRFVKMGLSRRRAVQMVHLMALMLGLSVLPLLWGDLKTACIIVVQALIFLLIITIMQIGAAGSINEERRKGSGLPLNSVDSTVPADPDKN
jgi:UDP-GlcNAc:undecaprenyl-phosphate GlcNAc-1-phosphate transferase